VIVDLDLKDCGSDLDKVFHRAREAALNIKSAREVCRCWDILQIWSDWFHERFGELQLIRHRSPPDDPPDIDLIFSARSIACEETRLLPEHIGRADALRDSEIAPDVCTTVPAISKPIANNKELIELMLAIKPDEIWTDVADEHSALARLLAQTIRRKMSRLPNGGVIAITDDVAVMGHTLEFLFQTAEELIMSEQFKDFDKYILLIRSRPNIIQFNSALITRQAGRKMLSKS
jgi:hypothetical protein